jgi:hypothetical protein
MATDRFDEARLADAWTRGAPPDASACPPADMFWDAARAALSPSALQSLLDHTAGCGACALALKTACEIHVESQPSSTPAKASLWKLLRATMLRPEAALAYLLLLAVSFPLYRALTPSITAVSSPTSVVTGARVVGLEPESIARGAETTPPAAISAEAGEALILRLFVDREDLSPKEPLHVTVRSGEQVLYDRTRGTGTLGEQSTLDLLIEPAAVPTGKPLVITVTSGSAELFRRSVSVAVKR